MATTYNNDIQKLYVAYFNRPADKAGLDYYETIVEKANGSTAAISAEFAKSAEYKAAYANMTNSDIVNAVYQNLFGRPADDAGKKYYADLLDAKKLTIDVVVTEVARGAQGTDAVAYGNKVTAAAAFTTALDLPAEQTGYSGDAANKVAKAFLATVTDNLSLQAATGPTALNTSVAAAVSAGTPFSITSALTQVSTANKAVDTFVQGIDVDSNPATVTVSADIATAQNTAITKVATDMTGGVAGGSGSLFVAATTSQTVRDALISAQQATNSATLTSAQQTLATDNANIAKVAGLADAASTLAAATTASKAAVAAEVTARADLTAKEAGFGVSNGGNTVTLVAATTGATPTPASLQYTKAAVGATPAAVVTLATIGADGKATLATGLDATKYVGLTELIASYNTEVNAVANVDKAQTNTGFAQLGVNMLDIAPDAAGTVGSTGLTESALIAQIAAGINASVPTGGTPTVATGATPTVAQIQTQLAVLKAATDQTAYTNFKALVDAESAVAAAPFNPLVAKQTTDTTAVTTATNAISTFTKDVNALQTANSNVNTLAGLKATADTYAKVLTDKGYAVTTLDATHTANFAGAASDIYVVSKADASIAAFGLQGTDSLFVGTGYTLVQGAIGATGVKGSDAAMEIFVSTANGDTKLQIETHAYSSSVQGAATGEIVTITLTGVDASTIKMDSTGIITGHA
jgi:hypothetical protein